MSNSNYMFKLNDAAKQYAEKQLNETEESRKNGIKTIKQWIKENPTINAKPDDKSILAFLRGCKFNLERTKQKLRNYYEMRRDVPEWFENRNPMLIELQELIKLGVFVPLKKTNDDNELVVIIRAAAHDPIKHKQDDVFKAGKMILDIAAMENENAQIYGVTAIFDMKGLTMAHGRQMTPRMIKKSVFAWHNYHCRPKRLEFINAPSYINVVLRVFKSFMSNKLKGRVQIHSGGLQSLHKVVKREILPKEYGGDDEELKELAQYWFEKILAYKDWFEHDEQYKAI